MFDLAAGQAAVVGASTMPEVADVRIAACRPEMW